MFRVESNIEGILVRLQRDLQQVDGQMRVCLRQAGLDAQALIAFRIQQQGRGSDGQVLRTHAIKQAGAYSAEYAKHRTERGRQVAQVDFTMEGNLMRSFTVLDVSDELVTVGFSDDRQADIAEYLEAYFGDAFGLTNNEQNTIIEGLVDRLVNGLKA